MFTNVPRLQRSVLTDHPWLFLSPHLDDAVLSCGALLKESAGTRDITVATIFTDVAAPPHTHAARSFIDQCAAPDADVLFEMRRTEDRHVLKQLGVRHMHVGLADALFRQRQLAPGFRFLGRRLPELAYRYPTYRFDIALGRIARGDRALIEDLRSKVADLLEHTGAELLFCPLGVGRHVDHVISRLVGSYFPDHVVYYADFPYSLSFPLEERFIGKYGLNSGTWDRELVAKQALIRGYATQADALFPDGQIPVVPETYFASAR
ncbi:PIG-L deacetylase family protein [uncultured Arthrobacter sp.]|uniref:PIG-L deacetylase family protein n=1 Tax=uncultured Arthrobacter sp. TaxID=114050 RepID=UPI002631C5F1|nr:PIG-L family deacetylase [uncultured Arthrobacter sp.]